MLVVTVEIRGTKHNIAIIFHLVDLVYDVFVGAAAHISVSVAVFRRVFIDIVEVEWRDIWRNGLRG